MIKTGNSNEPIPDFNEMMNEVGQDMERQDLEQSIVARVPELQQLNTNIDKAATAVINAKLTLETGIEESRQVRRQLSDTANGIHKKVDTINGHIDNVMKDAPTKLHISVSVSDQDMKTIHEIFAKEHEWVIGQMQLQLKVMNVKSFAIYMIILFLFFYLL